jgi:hypothetical protein
MTAGDHVGQRVAIAFAGGAQEYRQLNDVDPQINFSVSAG